MPPCQPPGTCRCTNTVRNPTAMNVAVATSERSDPRDSPHTPWSLVHPPA